MPPNKARETSWGSYCIKREKIVEKQRVRICRSLVQCVAYAPGARCRWGELQRRPRSMWILQSLATNCSQWIKIIWPWRRSSSSDARHVEPLRYVVRCSSYSFSMVLYDCGHPPDCWSLVKTFRVTSGEQKRYTNLHRRNNNRQEDLRMVLTWLSNLPEKHSKGLVRHIISYNYELGRIFASMHSNVQEFIIWCWGCVWCLLSSSTNSQPMHVCVSLYYDIVHNILQNRVGLRSNCAL